MSQVQTGSATAAGAARSGLAASRERLQALERGLEALAFVNRYGSCSSGQVSKALRLKRPTTHRILSVLVGLGLLRYDALSRQYILCARVRELSSGFSDEAWITGPALALMTAWTREHRWPLVLTTPVNRLLTVRASTDYESPISVDRFLAGQIVPIDGSAAGILYRAYTQPRPAEPEDLAGIRKAGYVARLTACFTGARISVPLIEQRRLLACLTMRCRAEIVQNPAELARWVGSLKSVARDIREEATPILGLR